MVKGVSLRKKVGSHDDRHEGVDEFDEFADLDLSNDALSAENVKKIALEKAKAAKDSVLNVKDNMKKAYKDAKQNFKESELFKELWESLHPPKLSMTAAELIREKRMLAEMRDKHKYDPQAVYKDLIEELQSTDIR